jgi:crotonobetainyl-CoA:carnitine CoA-transferase CaiB-like acyl-CoA transferase
MLSPYRVLDLCDDRGQLAGHILAQLGADVIAVEPPDGQRSRHEGPFAGDVVDPERSLTHWAFSRGKRSVVVRDPGELDALAAGADVLIECGAIDVDLDRLTALNPALVVVSITPFGSDGPKARWLATDLTIAAAGGQMALNGDRDRAPVRMSNRQAWLNASLDATVAAMVALHERHRSGLGQRADISAQQSMIVCTQFQMMYALVGPDEVVRVAGGVELGPFTVQYVHECLDGQVTVTFLFGQMIGPFTSRLFRWMHEEGACDESLATKDWIGFFARVIEGTEPPSELARGNAAIAAFVATRTKDELLAAALERHLLIAPITTTSDVLALGQLRDREYWEDLDGVTFPGSIAKMSGRPLRVLGRPPRLGEHTDEVRAERRRAPSAPPAADPPAADRPLAGVKVLDFMWAFAGPYATRILADYGATVVKIETSRKVDVLRVVAPWNDPSQSVDSALQYHSLNAGKLGLALDLTKPGARDVVLDLVRWADVVTESFSPKAMRAWDLGYDTLRAVNPDLVMLSSCLMGQTGPMHRYAGFGTMAAAVAGFYPGVGWPDRPPCGPFTAYTDYTSPRFAVAVLLAALDWRRRTGEGQFIDFSQMEACLHLLAPELLDDAVNGRVAGRVGNRDRSRAPHGAYPTAGDDRWIAIAVETDEQWRSMCAAASLPPELAELDACARLSRQDELDALLSAWTARRDTEELQEALQQQGIPAHQVQNSRQCVADPQLLHRGQFLQVPHPVVGTTWVEGSPIRLWRTPGYPAWGGPMFGQHLPEVLTDILGYDDERITELIVAGALE